jgi:hypothetical protein
VDDEGTGGDRDLAPATGTPRWVYVSGAIALVVVIVVVIVHLAGGGFRGHGPAGVPGGSDPAGISHTSPESAR